MFVTASFVLFASFVVHFPVSRRLQVSVDCPRQIISACMTSGAGVIFLVQGFGREALVLLAFQGTIPNQL
ncbi:MAG: hypothetical protein CBB71_17725 [Rhodopirellula sp. TMED11]|nr:MAG: hypothetical protein CBB71_17725 [Rhodopirellula sp. TMED11]